MSKGRAIALDWLKHMAEAVRTIESYAARGRAAFDDLPHSRAAQHSARLSSADAVPRSVLDTSLTPSRTG